MKKRSRLILVSLLSATFFLTSCKQPDITSSTPISSPTNSSTSPTSSSSSSSSSSTTQIESIALDTTTTRLLIGGTHQITATVMPEKAENKELTYTSDDPAIATVTSDGLVTALKLGTTKITVASKEDSSVSATLEVSVVDSLASVAFHISLTEQISSQLDLLVATEKDGFDLNSAVALQRGADGKTFTGTIEEVNFASNSGADDQAFEYKLVINPKRNHAGYGYTYSFPEGGTQESIGTLAKLAIDSKILLANTAEITHSDLTIDTPIMPDDADLNYFISRFYAVDDNNADVTDKYRDGLVIYDSEGHVLDTSKKLASVAIGSKYHLKLTLQKQAEGILKVVNATSGLLNDTPVAFTATDKEGFVWEAEITKTSRDTNLKIYIEQQYGFKVDEQLIPLIQSLTIAGKEITKEQMNTLNYYPALAEMKIIFKAETKPGIAYKIVGQKINAPDSYAFESKSLLAIAYQFSYTTKLTRNDLNLQILTGSSSFPAEQTRFNIASNDFANKPTVTSDGKNYNDGRTPGYMVFNGIKNDKAWSTWRYDSYGGQDGADCWFQLTWDSYYTIRELHIFYYTEGMIPTNLSIEYGSIDGKFGTDDGLVLTRQNGITIAEEKQELGFDNNYVLNGDNGIITDTIRIHVPTDSGSWFSVSEVEVYVDISK